MQTLLRNSRRFCFVFCVKILWNFLSVDEYQYCAICTFIATSYATLSLSFPPFLNEAVCKLHFFTIGVVFLASSLLVTEITWDGSSPPILC